MFEILYCCIWLFHMHIILVVFSTGEFNVCCFGCVLFLQDKEMKSSFHYHLLDLQGNPLSGIIIQHNIYCSRIIIYSWYYYPIQGLTFNSHLWFDLCPSRSTSDVIQWICYDRGRTDKTRNLKKMPNFFWLEPYDAVYT